MQGPRRDSGSAWAKNVLDALENDTKVNFWENIPGKVQFQKMWWAMTLDGPPTGAGDVR